MGQYRFKDSSGNIVAQISGSAEGNIIFSGSTIDFSAANDILLGEVQLAGTASNALLLDGFDSTAFVFTSSFNTISSSISSQLTTLQTTSGSNIERLNNIESVTGSYETKGNGIVSGSSQVIGILDSLNTYTSSVKNAINVIGEGSSSVTTVYGNLVVEGTTITVSASNLAIADNMIYLNDGNTITDPDLGIAGNYNDGTYSHAGIFSDASDSHTWKVYKGYTIEPSQSIDITHGSFTLADFEAATLKGSIAATNGVVSGSSQVIGILSSLNAVSASLIAKTGSLATTGSNTFNGNEIISGNVLITGSVGIGTTNPTSKLHVINNVDGFIGRFTGGASSNIIAGIYADTTRGFASIGVQSAHQFRLFTNDADRLTVTSDGSVGIGTTNPQAHLHLFLTGNSTRFRIGAGSTYAALIDFYNDSTARWSIGVDNSQTYGKLENRVLATDAIRFYDSTNNVVLTPSSGIVGVGITNPTNTKFYVNASGISQTVSAVEIAVAGSGAFQRGVRMLNGGMVAGESLLYMVGRNSVPKNTGQMYFYYDGDGSNSNRLSLGLYAVDDVLNINGLGNIGIGTTLPTQKFHIMGSTGLPATSGTSQPGTLRLQLSGYGTVLDFGGEGPATGKQWIQATDASSLSYTYPLLLNPRGGIVGIGTASPSAKLDVWHSSAEAFRVTNDGNANGNNPTAQFYNSYGNHSWGICAEFRIGNLGGSDRGSILFSHAYDTNTWGIGFGYNDSSYFRINKDQGPYGGGWGSTLFSLDRSGNYSFSGSNVSDKRNKKNITYIEDSQLSTILKLKPAAFNKKSPGKNEYSNHIHTGFIAQDVLIENIPNLVHGNEEEGYGLDYDGILALAVKSIQELEARVRELEN